MRKRRAIIYDNDLVILNIMQMYFELRGYDVITNREPVACPVYDDIANCDNLSPCADVMLLDQRLSHMTGTDLIRLQRDHGCRLSVQNKAVILGFLDDDVKREIGRLGCSFFEKPIQFEQVEEWLRTCEGRIDTSAPLGFKRKEQRSACSMDVVYHDEKLREPQLGAVMNRSSSGLCLKVRYPLDRWEVVRVMTAMPLSSNRLMVRWYKADADGKYLMGLSCC